MKRRPFIASALAVSALLAAASGMVGTALADTDQDIIGFPVMTFGTGTDSNAGEYTYNLGLLNYNEYDSPDRLTTVADLGVATNGFDLGDTVPGASGVDITDIVDGITAQQLQEWADKGWVHRQDSGSQVVYDADVLAVQQLDGDDSVEPVGGYATDGGRAMHIALTWVDEGDGVRFGDIDTYDICGGSGIVENSLASFGGNAKSIGGPVFCNISQTTVHATGHKHWQGDGKDMNLNEAYRDTFDLDLLYKEADGTLTRPALEPSSLGGRPHVVPKGTDAPWDRDGGIGFGTITIGMDDALDIDTSPISADSYYTDTDLDALSAGFDGHITFSLEEDGDAEQVTKPENIGEVTVNVTWDPESNEFTAGIAEPITVTNTYTAPQKVTVSFDTQAGDVSAPDAISGNPGMTVSDPVLQRDGYRFTGWYLDPDCTVPFNFDTPVQEDVTLYAGWEEIAAQQVTVSFDAQAEGVTNPSSQVVDEGGTAVSPELDRDGYVLTGWYLDPECTQPFDFSTPIDQDMTLYAGWEQTEAPQEATPTDEPADDGNDTADADDFAGEEQQDGLADTGAAIGIVVSVLAAAACLGAGILTFRHTHRDRR